MVKLSEDGKWYRVSLRLRGDSLPVDEVGMKLGLEPTSVGRKGEHFRGNPRYAEYQSNVWVWNYPAESDVPFEEQVGGLLGVIEPKRSTLLEILSPPDVEGELFLGFGSLNGQGGALFSPGLLKRVAECGLSLDLDLYPPPGTDDEADL